MAAGHVSENYLFLSPLCRYVANVKVKFTQTSGQIVFNVSQLSVHLMPDGPRLHLGFFHRQL